MQARQLSESVIIILLLAIAAIALGIFIPGFIHYQNKSFSSKDIPCPGSWLTNHNPHLSSKQGLRTLLTTTEPHAP